MTLDSASSERFDAQSLSAQLLRPQRALLTSARALADGAASGEDAWQRLHEAGVLPDALFQSPDRRFAVVDTEWSSPPTNAEGIDLRSCPSTVDAAIALGSDAPRMIEAERLARALRARLIPWGAKAPTEIDWIVLTHLVRFNFEQGPVFNCAKYSLEYALEEIGVDAGALHPDHPWLPESINEVIRANEGWAIAVAESLEIPAAYGAPHSIVGTPFESLENPFEISLRFWTYGYIEDHRCYDNVDRIRVYTTVVDAPWNMRRQTFDRIRARET